MKEKSKGPASEGNECKTPTGQSNIVALGIPALQRIRAATPLEPRHFNDAHSSLFVISAQDIIKGGHYFYKLSLPTFRYDCCV